MSDIQSRSIDGIASMDISDRAERLPNNRDFSPDQECDPWYYDDEDSDTREVTPTVSGRGDTEPEGGAFVLPEHSDGGRRVRPSSPLRSYVREDVSLATYPVGLDQGMRTPRRLVQQGYVSSNPYRGLDVRNAANSSHDYAMRTTPERSTFPRSSLQNTDDCTVPCTGALTTSGFFDRTPARYNRAASNRSPYQVPPTIAPPTVHPVPVTEATATTGNKGRKKAWWVIECFVQGVFRNGEKKYICSACRTCKSIKLTASRLADHVWACPLTKEDVKTRLLQTCIRIRNKVLRYSGGSPELLSEGRQRNRSAGGSAPKLIEQCSQEDADDISMDVVRGAIEMCLPFTLFDKPKKKVNFIRRAFSKARPGYANSYPSRHTATVKYLEKMYDQTKSVVNRIMNQMLRKGFGTVIFDGWDDITQSSVVNILIRIESNSNRKTFFLDSVFTGHTRMGASEYVKIVEQVMQKYGGLCRVCGVASDSARACVNARNALSRKYKGLIGIQDQAHVADLLMKDIGKLDFVKDIIDKVNFLVNETRSKRKLLSFVRDEVNAANQRMRREEHAQSRRSPVTQVSPPVDPLSPEFLFPPLRKTAVMLRRPATTRFASISDTLEAFIRTREVLGKVSIDPQFDRNLFTADKPEQVTKRRQYKALISDPQFYESVKELHNVFRLCRRYLREFDKETETSAADVFGYTEYLEKALEKVPTSDIFMTVERLEIIKARFKKRKDGPTTGRGMQVRLVEDVHVAAFLLHPTKCPSDYQPYYQRLYSHVKRYVSSTLFPSPANEEGMEIEEVTNLEQDRNASINKIMNAYEDVHARWQLVPPPTASALAQVPRNATLEQRESLRICVQDEYAFRINPLRFWNEELRTGNCPELCELALRVLSISPSSCAAERSFSAQGRIRTRSRNRLSPDIVRKMMFVKWNIKHLDESVEGFSYRSDTSDGEETNPSDDDGMESEGIVEDSCPDDEDEE